MSEDLEKRVAQLIALRDRMKAMDDAHALAMKPFKEAKEKLENVVMMALNASNVDSVKTSAGTAYKTVAMSATIADGSEFQRHVIGTQSWDLLDWRVNKPAAAKLAEETGAPPPGVNFSSFVKLGVRRANEASE